MKNRKIVLIGCGSVGTSFIYSAINQGLAQEYVIIDVNNDAAEGNALDFDDCNFHCFSLIQNYILIECFDISELLDSISVLNSKEW